ncbi:MAG TPA: DNA polymerase ligase N-terminal domain-containing protein [Candidatus Kapabacteria bacterium]|jgi:bifunctional non-homologous end joining protein LigD|nr:DNA polymerase ligase N-terminal domain-containing protein [Candidatus Kapabacteria bacterium]
MPLKLYHKKRDFKKTKEPKGRERKKSGRSFVVQEHHATRLHFDFRLEMEGVMKSWAVPKGPSMNPSDKHLAVMVEDHPIEYSSFQGAIPEGEYGAGEVRRWDHGTYEPIGDLPIEEQLETGKLTFILKGKKLKGEFHMVQMKARTGDEPEGKNWLIFKHEDEYSDPDWVITPILNYGSRSQSPKRKEKSQLGAKVLEQLVQASKTKKTRTKRTVGASGAKTKLRAPRTKARASGASKRKSS